MQYTTATGLGGGTLLTGWKGAIFKEWTFLPNIAAGTGLPLTPVFLAAVSGTGVTGPIRPNYNGGFDLNPIAHSAPLPGQWGNAGCDSITGPSQFPLDASLARIFRLKDRLNLELGLDSTKYAQPRHVDYVEYNDGQPPIRLSGGQPTPCATYKRLCA